MTWRPLTRRGRDDGGPRPLGPSLARLADDIGAPAPDLLTCVFARWADAVGELVAEHAKPVALRNGTLVVAVDDPAWATQLRYLGPQLLARVCELAGQGGVDQLEIRVRPPSSRRV